MTDGHGCLYDLALAINPAFSPREKIALVKGFGGARAAIDAGDGAWTRAGLAEDQKNALRRIRLEDAEKLSESARRQGVRIVTYGEPAYPPRLKEIGDPPLALFVRGDETLLNGPRMLAVVGSRRMTAYGAAVVRRLVPELVAAGFTVVSGLAFGVDAAAHEACIEAGGRTVAVQAMGVIEPYPRSHSAIFKRLLAKDAVASEFFHLPKYTGPEFFPRRNRIISGLCEGVLVVEAAEKSGTLVTAACALDQNRQVFVVPGDIFSPLSAGCHRLIKQGAKPVTEAGDIIDDLIPGLPRQAELFPKSGEIPAFANELEKKLYDSCRETQRSADELVENSRAQPGAVIAALSRMELEGWIERTGAGVYRAV